MRSGKRTTTTANTMAPAADLVANKCLGITPNTHLIPPKNPRHQYRRMACCCHATHTNPKPKTSNKERGKKHKHNTRTPKKNCRLSKHKCKRPAMTSTAGNQALSADVTFSKQKMRERERNKRGGEKNIIDNSRIALSLLFAAGSFKVVNQSDHLQNQPNMIPLAKTIIRQVCNKVLLAQQTDLF